MSQYYGYAVSYQPLISARKQDYHAQEQMMDDYCEAHNIPQYSFNYDFAGKSFFARPSLRKMLVQMNCYDILLIATKDCISRDSFLLALFLRIMQKQKLSVLCIDDPCFSVSHPSAEFQKSMDALSAFERTCTSLNFSKGKAKRLLAGKKASGVAPLGYRWNEHGNIVIDEEQASLVQDIFDLYLQIGSIGKLQKHLETSNTISPRGKVFSKEALRVILTNEYYAGFLCEKDYHGKGKHQAIIDKVVFNAVEVKLQANRKNRS